MLLGGACPLEQPPDLDEVGVDESIPFPCVSLGHGPEAPGHPARPAGLATRPPGGRRLGGSQEPVTQEEERGGGHREQASPGT